MSESTKTHYRKVYKSDHLGIADLEDFIEEKKGLIYTIKEVRQETNVSVAGRKGSYNIAYFNEPIKPLVLNATNSKLIKKFSDGSPFVEDWVNIVIELYIDSTVKMKGEVVGGVRIKTQQPIITKPELTPNHPKWEDAKAAVTFEEATIDSIRKNWNITQENFDKLCG